MENILEIRNVSKSFGANKVLADINLDIRAGEIHALCGENGAGKSTLMNVTAGILKRDSGDIIFNGKSVNFNTAREAVSAGIAFVHQELALCQHLTVAENMWMWNIPRKAGIIDHKELYRRTDEILSNFDADFDARAKVSTLSVAQQQIAEIAKAISLDAKMIILDEPTSSITDEEAENLFRVCDDLRKQGVGIVYISHRMNEVFKICDRVTVLRDGVMVMTENIKDVDENKVIVSMVGREISDFYPPKSNVKEGEELLRAEHLTGIGFEDISFRLQKGRILGFSGLVGAGRSELMQAMVGLRTLKSGDIYLKGEKVSFKNYGEAIKKKVCYLTEDRKKNGLFLNMAISRNMVASIINEISKNGFVSQKMEDEISAKHVEELRVKTTGTKQKVGSLSGGNQQKALIAKWMSVGPDILIMDEPTRGIDVGAKSEIHHMLRRLADEGIGIIVISSEMPEIIGVADEVVVMHEGKFTGFVKDEMVNENNLVLLASNKKIDQLSEEE